MEIERAIYASVKKGIEGREGITYFSYTSDYKRAINGSSDKNLEGVLTSFYEPPKVDEAYPYHDDPERKYALPKDLDELNKLEDGVIKKYIPRTFAFRKTEIDGKERGVFMYGKFMGADWAGNRYSNKYRYLVLCDLEDIDIHPVFYCSSPIVACDIKRAYFYPKNGQTPEPSILPYVEGLEAKFDRDVFPHNAGFDEIEKEDMVSFINETDMGRIDLLISMVESLLKLKSGDPNSRIVIADAKENMLLWIAAISYVFPKELALDISFISYADVVGEYDITGVFVPELNGCQPEDDATLYNYNNICDCYSVYDYKQNIFAPNISLDGNSLFYTMIEMAYSMDLTFLDSYKEYILTS